MSQSVRRVAATAAIALSTVLLTGGVAHADDTSIWLVPGVDLGPVLGLTVDLPAKLLAPVVDLLS
ncbi:hypothetical protein [Saccharopolyspora dendranthemae]|uniref:Uncharacterized protein n=1 Tax=Saccharopolyspora dendranthemae TaxID=1181886 RepID=A0A561VB40_9PSEU|nr:hypothetical protein [Saccharopolyspora dendranthemae]TWG08839.1 hypothetical protein FHU35_111465 [Saccharopolyspora dendranthemae]